MGNCFSSKNSNQKSKSYDIESSDPELVAVLTSEVPKLKRDDKQKSMVHPTWSRDQMRKAEAFIGGTVEIQEIEEV